MATYVVLARFTDQGVKNAKDSPKRAEAFRQMAETFGGGFYVSHPSDGWRA